MPVSSISACFLQAAREFHKVRQSIDTSRNSLAPNGNRKLLTDIDGAAASTELAAGGGSWDATTLEGGRGSGLRPAVLEGGRGGSGSDNRRASLSRELPKVSSFSGQH